MAIGGHSVSGIIDIKHNFHATVAPAVTDDITKEYDEGSQWVDETNNKSYVCVDNAAGAAVWQQTSGAGAVGLENVVEDTTPQLGGNLDLNNFDLVTAANGAGATNPIDITTGVPTGGSSGTIIAASGATSGSDASGFMRYRSGASTGTGATGTVIVKSGDKSGTTGNSGNVTIGSGTNSNSVSGSSGTVTVESGTATADASGTVSIRTGATTNTANSGGVSIYSGNAAGAGSGGIALGTGTIAGNISDDSGDIWLFSGAHTATDGSSGQVQINSGTSATGNTGQILLATGDATTDNSGDVILRTGTAGTTRGTISLDGETKVLNQAYHPESTLTDAANIDWNVATAQTAKVTLAGNRTLNAPTNMKAGATYILRVIQDGTGSRTLAFNSAYKFPGGTDPTITITAGAIDILSFYSDGTNMYGVAIQNFS